MKTDPFDNHDALRWALEQLAKHAPEIDRPDNALRMHQLRLLRDEFLRETRK